MEDSRLRSVRSLVFTIVIASVLLTSLKIISYGYLPVDDALRHAAKVVSGKSWQEIVVLRPDMITDRHEGWHVFLSGVYGLTGCSVESLVVFSVIFLAVLFLLAPLPWLARPEVWPGIVAGVAVLSPLGAGRMFYGRPFIFTMMVLMTVCLLWRRLKSEKLPAGVLSVVLVLVAISTWTHGVPHLYFLPVVAFLLAREWVVAVRFGVVVVLGAILGASLTGHPVLFIQEGLLLSFRAFSDSPLQRMLVSEFQAFSGDASFMLGIVIVLLWRRVRGEWNTEQLIRDPVFLLMCLGWALGFSVRRFWLDWGLVAALAWLAAEMDTVAQRRLSAATGQRIVIALCGGLLLYFSMTSDFAGRWTSSLTKQHLSVSDPVQREWLPDPGGIVYSDSNSVFYDMFYTNPRAPWRYLLAFEPTLMPDEDLQIWRRIQWNEGAYSAFAPWVAKMKPADRLILSRDGSVPNIGGLEWASPARNIWVGRLPRARQAEAGAAPARTKEPARR